MYIYLFTAQFANIAQSIKIDLAVQLGKSWQQ